jgi:hypothetical protein
MTRGFKRPRKGDPPNSNSRIGRPQQTRWTSAKRKDLSGEPAAIAKSEKIAAESTKFNRIAG